MDLRLCQSPYNLTTGFAVKRLPFGMFQLLDNLISRHLQLTRSIRSFAPEEYEDLLDELKQFKIKSRESRTLSEDSCRSVSGDIIEQLSSIMPKPKRLHNNDIYCRVVIASDKQTVSVPHRDEYPPHHPRLGLCR